MNKKTPLTKPVSIRLNQKVRDKVKSLSEETGLMQAQIFDILLRSACEALDEYEDEKIKLPLPLKLRVIN
jgi:predicted DNA-binding protein